ncbi:hypothetical protein [Neobacillus sp. NPDC093127]|uniref:hypothetical protein n=1 Tax=Neobacillus sp. NPDC093127 TaxID=3364296 RepID=UPI0037FB6B35
MKKLLIANLLLLFSLIYVVVRITHSSLYLPQMYINAENPVSFHWNFIAIDTGLIQDKIGNSMPVSIYLIWMTPIYLLVLVSLILTFLALKQKK